MDFIHCSLDIAAHEVRKQTSTTTETIVAIFDASLKISLRNKQKRETPCMHACMRIRKNL
jgi:hypothetical protein